jgi:hypothetical protein
MPAQRPCAWWCAWPGVEGAQACVAPGAGGCARVCARVLLLLVRDSRRAGLCSGAPAGPTALARSPPGRGSLVCTPCSGGAPVQVHACRAEHTQRTATHAHAPTQAAHGVCVRVRACAAVDPTPSHDALTLGSCSRQRPAAARAAALCRRLCSGTPAAAAVRPSDGRLRSNRRQQRPCRALLSGSATASEAGLPLYVPPS